MIERFQFNSAYILVLSLLLHVFVSCSHPEFVQDVASNAEDTGSVIEEQRDKLDPSIEQIFRGPSQTRTDKANSKRDVDKVSIHDEDASERARVKRANAVKKSNTKNLNDAKRSVSNGESKASSRISRASRDLPKLPSKDYEIPLDQDKSEYSDEAEDESAKDSNYRSSDLRAGEDSERFVDQEERSRMYDDFESKDVVKRGVPGGEDYDEAEEEGAGDAEDVAALEDGSVNEETDKRKIQGDVRVKRDRENSKDASSAEVSDKMEISIAAGDSSSDRKAAEESSKRDTVPEKDSKAGENQSGKVDKDQGDQVKRNAAEKSDSDASKGNSDGEIDASKQALMANDQTDIEGNENSKQRNQESEEATGDGKAQEAGLSSSNGAPSESIADNSAKGSSAKIDQAKVAEAPSSELPKAPANVAEDVGKADSSKNEAAAREQEDADYEKRVEEQIQRKIDSIKEQIKREIAESQRVKEIEENNAKFDELREQEDDDEDALEDSSKRSARNVPKSEGAEKRLIRRRKRQDVDQEKAQGVAELGATKKTCRTTTKKRSVAQAESPAALRETPRKRERPRRVVLVRRDGKKKRRRRSKNAAPADLALDSGSRGSVVDGQSSGSKVAEDEKTVAERDSSLERKSTGGNEDLGPLASEYGEAFGGLNGEPGVALARFKRIKRVLRPPASKT